jgi:hypothetical protein
MVEDEHYPLALEADLAIQPYLLGLRRVTPEVLYPRTPSCRAAKENRGAAWVSRELFLPAPSPFLLSPFTAEFTLMGAPIRAGDGCSSSGDKKEPAPRSNAAKILYIVPNVSRQQLLHIHG